MNNENPTLISIVDKQMFISFCMNLFNFRKIYGNSKVFLLTTKDVIEENRAFFKHNNIITYDISRFKEKFSNYKMINESINWTTLVRLEIYEIIPNLDKEHHCIFMDSDTLITRKIPNNYFELTENIAFIDSPNEDIELRRKIKNFWSEILNTELYIKIEKLIDSGNYFNAGIVIINNHDSFKQLLLKSLKSGLLIDDQTLLNSFNENNVLVINDIKMNNQIKHGFEKNAIIYHFSGDWKFWKVEDENKRKIIAKTGIYNITKEVKEWVRY